MIFFAVSQDDGNGGRCFYRFDYNRIWNESKTKDGVVRYQEVTPDCLTTEDIADKIVGFLNTDRDKPKKHKFYMFNEVDMKSIRHDLTDGEFYEANYKALQQQYKALEKQDQRNLDDSRRF